MADSTPLHIDLISQWVKANDEAIATLAHRTLKEKAEKLTLERSPAMFPQATYDVFAIGLLNFVENVLKEYVESTANESIDAHLADKAGARVDGWIRGRFSYTTLFNAIGAAVTWKEHKALGISVKEFEDAMLEAAPQPEAIKEGLEGGEIDNALRILSDAATPGEWMAMRDGNQYLETRHLPSAKAVGASRIEGPKRPWNPHALLSFGFKPEEYETVRFIDADADFVCALVNAFRKNKLFVHPQRDAADAEELNRLRIMHAEGITEDMLCALLPGCYYMDPPDGGDTSIYEQLKRMSADAARYRWIREYGVPALCIYIDGMPNYIGETHSDTGADRADRAIDAAMAAGRGEVG